MEAEVIVIGAGAAGLIAARELEAAGTSVLLLEARDRAGGRILTIRDPRAGAPVELGAEFIHGNRELTLRLLEEAGIPRCETGGDADDEWEEQQVDALLKHCDELTVDMSVSTFVDRFAGDPSMHNAAEELVGLVEGFDAADPRIASIEAFAEEWFSEASIRGSGSRPLYGYAPLVEHLLRSLHRTRVQFRSTVQHIEWKRGSVTVRATRDGREDFHTARRAIVTVPLPMLQQQHISFDPPLPSEKLQALGLLEMGPVYRVVLLLDESVWERAKGGALREHAFIHTPGQPFPTIWRSLPVRSRTLVAWVGGPKAALLQKHSEEDIIARALESAEKALGISLGDALENAYVHDWQRDRFSLGAYSYAKVGGITARETLAQPVEQTLFFAGEACAGEGYAGTVAGALESGAQAAKAVLSTLE